MATRKDTAFLFVPAIIGGIILLAIILLDIQFLDMFWTGKRKVV